MTDIDSVDPSFDDIDADDYNLGKEEEAALLCEDDDDLLEELPKEDGQDNHRDKFASERIQAQQEEHESTPKLNSNREHHQPRFNRNRLGGRGGWGRGGPKPSYNNGPSRISRQIYVNPSMFKKEQKPVQSVEPWLNPPRSYGQERSVQSVPFVGQLPVYNQPQSTVNQATWQPPIQQPQMQPNNFERPMQQQLQFYPNQMNQNPSQFQQQYSNQAMMHQNGPPKPNYNQNLNQQPNFSLNYNTNFSQHPQQPAQPCYQNQSQQQFQPQQQFLPASFNSQIQHNVPPMQPNHLPPHMQQSSNYYEPYLEQQNFNQNQNYPTHNHNGGPPQYNNQHFNHQNPGLNHPPRHPGPLLQRPAMLSHEGGQFREDFNPKHLSYQPEPHNRHFNQAPRHNFSNSINNNGQSWQWLQQKVDCRQNQSQNNFGHRGNYRGGRGGYNYNQRPAFKRRNEEWNENQSDYNQKRRVWTNEEEAKEEETQYEEDDCSDEKKEVPIKVEIKIDAIPEIEEDEETKAYRLKIEEQKRLRLKILAEKERKRKEAILRKNGEVCDIPAIESSPQKEPQRVKPVIRTGVNPNLRVLTRSDGEKVELSLGSKAAALVKVKIKPGSPAIASPDARKLTCGLFSNRQVIAKDGSLIDTPLVIVRNLAASSTESKLRKLCHSVGLVQSLEMSSKERQAKICFKSVSSAHAFYKKYQRHMLDLSLIKVELVPQKSAE